MEIEVETKSGDTTEPGGTTGRRFHNLTMQYGKHLGHAIQKYQDKLEFEEALDRAITSTGLPGRETLTLQQKDGEGVQQ